MGATLYFHSPCFDGIVSAVIARRFLVSRFDWPSPELVSVNYHLRGEWLEQELADESAVVDFLYHPSARFWADHHPTSFLTEDSERHFRGRSGGRDVVYDSAAPSCAGLLWRHLWDEFGYRDGQYEPLVGWADRIDAARYDSVRQAIEADSPALRIAGGLGLGDSDGYCRRLVDYLSEQPLQQVDQVSEVADRAERVRSQTRQGLGRFEAGVRLEHGGIIVFDVDGEGTLINRYAPYYFYPDARYSVGIVRSSRGAKITTMRNPWREFESVHLGAICAEHGGGGHQRVGSIVLDARGAGRAREIVEEIARRIRAGERVVTDEGERGR